MSFKRIIAAVLSAATIVTSAFAFSGCADTSYAAKIEGTTIPAGLYILLEDSALYNAKVEIVKANPDAEEYDFFGTELEGMSFSEYVKKKTLDACKRYVAIEKKFDELGLKLSDSDNIEISNIMSSIWDKENNDAFSNYGTSTYGKHYEEMGISKASYKLYAANAKKELLIFRSIYDKNGTNPIAEDEVTKYINENYALGRFISVSLKDFDGNLITDADKLSALEKTANGYAEEIDNGSSFGEVYNEYQKYMGAPDSEITEIPDDTVFDRMFYVTDESPSVGFIKNIFTMGTDKASVYKDEYYYYVLKRYDILANETYESDYRLLALEGLKGSEYDASIEEYYAGYNVTVNQNSIDRYKPEDIKQ